MQLNRVFAERSACHFLCVCVFRLFCNDNKVAMKFLFSSKYERCYYSFHRDLLFQMIYLIQWSMVCRQLSRFFNKKIRHFVWWYLTVRAIKKRIPQAFFWGKGFACFRINIISFHLQPIVYGQMALISKIVLLK